MIMFQYGNIKFEISDFTIINPSRCKVVAPISKVENVQHLSSQIFRMKGTLTISSDGKVLYTNNCMKPVQVRMTDYGNGSEVIIDFSCQGVGSDCNC